MWVIGYIVKMYSHREILCSSCFTLYRDLPLYEDHKIRRAAAGEPTLLE